MQRKSSFLATVLLLSSAAANADPILFEATLDGAQEVPPVVTAASGSATGSLSGSAGSFVFSYEISYADLSSAIVPVGTTGGHLHVGAPGVNGGIAHILDTLLFDYTGTTAGTISGDWRFDDAVNPLTDDLAMMLLDGMIYINLHTEQNGSGELRGQFLVVSVPEPGTMALLVLGLAGLALRRRLRVL